MGNRKATAAARYLENPTALIRSAMPIPRETLLKWRRWLGIRDSDQVPDADFVIEQYYDRWQETGLRMSAEEIAGILKMDSF